MKPLKMFKHQGEWYLRTVPAKTLFRSTMVHEVVNRGDILAVRLSDHILTVIPGSSQVEHQDVIVSEELWPDLDSDSLRDILKEQRRGK